MAAASRPAQSPFSPSALSAQLWPLPLPGRTEQHAAGRAAHIKFVDMVRHITSYAVAEVGFAQAAANKLICRLMQLHGLQPTLGKAQHSTLAHAQPTTT